jgi:hypothetical protein
VLPVQALHKSILDFLSEAIGKNLVAQLFCAKIARRSRAPRFSDGSRNQQLTAA